MGCIADVTFQKFAAKYEQQYQSEWCWAACISMVYGYYKHPVGQSRIVTEAYGSPANIPAIGGLVIANELNRSWTDDAGQDFTSSLVAAFDAQAGVAAINNALIIQALADGYPLIVGAGGHATVATAITYTQTPLGPRVTDVGVFDPWPGRGPRALSMLEMTPAPLGGSLVFIALPQIS